jgi:hypothetical protein
MDAPLYDIYLTGKLADGVSSELAAQRLASLFKSTPEAMAGLITGKTQLLKRGVDKNTALKYRDTLQNAGCEVTFKAQPLTAVNEKAIVAQPTSPTPSSGLQLTPAGGDLLRPEERSVAAVVVVETSHLNLAPVGPLSPTRAAPIATPDTGYLSLAAAGGNLLNESERETPPAIAPDISGLSVAEIGAPLETLKNELPPLQPDISGLQLAPAGSDLLTPEQRERPKPAAPKTDHIKLAP